MIKIPNRRLPPKDPTFVFLAKCTDRNVSNKSIVFGLTKRTGSVNYFTPLSGFFVQLRPRNKSLSKGLIQDPNHL